MFDALGDKLEQVFKRLRGHGKITERHMSEALREVRMALLEADVALPVVTKFTEAIREQALGQEVLRSLTPEQHLLKFIHLELVRTMGGQAATVDLGVPPPVAIMLVGLQGSGKTTSAAKLARHLKVERGRRPYLVPADVYRPAAIDQLTTLGKQLELPVHPSTAAANPVDLARAGMTAARTAGHDTVIVDTAGRLQIDESLMQELVAMKAAITPKYVFLVADAMTGQDAVNVAQGFHDRLRIDGVVLTKLDGDARGGAALSLRAVTGAPIYFVGTGEKPEALEPFHPDRMASRILGQGDVLSLIEKVEKAYDQKQAEALEKKLRKNEFTLEDFRDQLQMVKKLGSMGDLLGMIPGMKKLAGKMDPGVADSELRRIEAIINSMTKEERRNDAILNGSRRRRIALGSGTNVAEVNRFLKQYAQTKKMMKKFTKMGPGGLGRLTNLLPG
ncbi:MAG: signal recognition particle protein [Polyangiaceae bacterium UTPRO1]|jgi:signal recognition particle subunit SRP54|nr:signal recognition particle protein [Myxococcales bacterium]OQY64851.1 MAG: signal recognition particle protein [Polyangiaceae bacterium UTPRO1]